MLQMMCEKGPRHFIPQSLHFWSHFIFGVTSYQREKLSLHTSRFIPSHFIQSDTSYQSLNTKSLHTEVTSYQSLHTKVTSYQSLHTKVTSYQSLHTSHFIPSVTSYRTHFKARSLHTSHLIPSHFIPNGRHHESKLVTMRCYKLNNVNSVIVS